MADLGGQPWTSRVRDSASEYARRPTPSTFMMEVTLVANMLTQAHVHMCMRTHMTQEPQTSKGRIWRILGKINL